MEDAFNASSTMKPHGVDAVQAGTPMAVHVEGTREEWLRLARVASRSLARHLKAPEGRHCARAEGERALGRFGEAKAQPP